MTHITFYSNAQTLLAAYLAVVENFVHRFRNKEDLSTVTADYKQEAVCSLLKSKGKLNKK